MGYGPVIQELKTRSLTLVADRAEALEVDLHSDLSAMIDRTKLREQIRQARGGQSDLDFSITFMRRVDALHQLDRWLKGAQDR